MTISPDPSNGYEAIAGDFMAQRSDSTIGVANVRAWARTLPRGAAILELGCGHGVPISETLIETSFYVHGVDASPTMTAAFRQRFPQAVVVCEAVEDSSFYGRRFDAVLAWGLMFLLPAETQVLVIERAGAVLEPGGRLLFTAPGEACSWTDVLTKKPSRSLGADGYARILARAGLVLAGEHDDEGGNHYFDAERPVP